MELPVERKLAAILSADVKGYSRLMADDDLATVETLTAYRDIIARAVERFRGRVIDAPGDNVLAEFFSAVDAVESAVAIQRDLETRNSTLPQNRRMEFRIGINLGDVIVKDGRLYGDGVNVAARIEGLAAAGGVAVSANVWEQVKNKVDLTFEPAGEHVVKNIPDAVRVYRVRTADVEPPHEALDVGRLRLPDEPSIAVLPFVNLSGDVGQDYFSDGITQDIITDLAKISGLFVIARHSAFVFKGRTSRVQDVSQALGVRYVLEGSVRLASDRVRVTAQLVDGTTGHHMWADRYDARVVDIFDVQDEITKRVVTELQVQLTSGEQARLWRRATTDVEAYDAFLRGREHLLSLRRDDNHRARALLERAIARDERFGPAMVLLGFTHLADAWYGWSTAPQESLQRAAQLATLALTFDDTNADPHALLGLSAVFQGHYDEAISHARRAVLLSPNSADIAASHADVLNLSGRPEDGLAEIRRAMRLSPTHPPYYLSVFGHACWLTARYGDAIATYRRYAALEPENPRPRIALAALLALSGRESDAHTAAQEVLRLHPRFSVDRWARQTPNRNAADLARDVAALRKAGLT